jgi:hypothetical protein
MSEPGVDNVEPGRVHKYMPITVIALIISLILAFHMGFIYTHIPAVMQHMANQALATNATIMGSNATHIIALRMQRAENTSRHIQEHLPTQISFGWRVHAWKAVASLDMCYKYVHSFETDKLVNHQRCLLITNGICAKTEVEMKEQHHANTKEMVVQGAHEAEREANRTMSVRKDEIFKDWFQDLVQHDDTEIWSKIMPRSWTSPFRADDHDIQEMLETIITCDEVLKVYNVTAEATHIAGAVYSKIPIICVLIFWGGVALWFWWYHTDAFNNFLWSVYTSVGKPVSGVIEPCITYKYQLILLAIFYVYVCGYPFTAKQTLSICTFFFDVLDVFRNTITYLFQFCSALW